MVVREDEDQIRTSARLHSLRGTASQQFAARDPRGEMQCHGIYSIGAGLLPVIKASDPEPRSRPPRAPFRADAQSRGWSDHDPRSGTRPGPSSGHARKCRYPHTERDLGLAVAWTLRPANLARGSFGDRRESDGTGPRTAILPFGRKGCFINNLSGKNRLPDFPWMPSTLLLRGIRSMPLWL